MIIEYTLLTTLAFHHLVIGSILILALLVIHKFTSATAETKSWLWMTALVIATVVPFTLITQGNQLANTLTNTTEQTVLLKNSPKAVVVNGVDIEREKNWHLPSEIVFNFSFLLTLAIGLWLAGSLWRSFMSLKTFNRTLVLIDSTLQEVPKLSSVTNVLVFSSSQVSSPLVVGLHKPKIIVPNTILEQLHYDQLTAIVLHENAHISRRDNWFGLFQELIAILFWWSPVVRALNKQIHVEREIACDLRAATQLNNGKQYAQSLIDCAKLMVTEQRNILAMGLFSKKKELNYRIGAVLKHKTKRTPKPIVIIALCFGLSISTLHATQLFSPKISIKHAMADARHFSLLPERESEALINAVKGNDIASIQSMQNAGVDINIPVIGDGTALMIAVKNNNKTMTQALINLGADVNQSSSGDGNPLIVAAMTNNVELARLLLDNGADVNAIVPRDETPLINASYFGYFSMTELLIDYGADVNLAVTTGMSDGYQVRSPLSRARTREIKEFLVANGAIK